MIESFIINANVISSKSVVNYHTVIAVFLKKIKKYTSQPHLASVGTTDASELSLHYINLLYCVVFQFIGLEIVEIVMFNDGTEKRAFV